MLATGTLQTVDNQIDTTTGTIKLRAKFENADEKLFPNQFVNIRLRVQTLQNATVIPAAAVQRASFGTFVYVVKPDSTVTIRRVDARADRGRACRRSPKGLAPHEQVVLEGVDELTEGAKVEVIPKAARARRDADARRRARRRPAARRGAGRARPARPGGGGRRAAP